LTDVDSYSGLGKKFVIRGWMALTIADVMQNIYFAIQALAVNKEAANKLFDEGWKKIIGKIENDSTDSVYKQLEIFAQKLNTIEKISSFENAVKVALVGEIYVRNDDFSRRELVEKLLEHHIVIKAAPIGEYLYYANYQMKNLYKKNIGSFNDKMRFKAREIFQRNIEIKIKKTLAQSGFYECELLDVENIIEHAKKLISPELEGETILTVGSALTDIIHHASGVISLGPFGCMPSRVAESILNVNMNIREKAKASNQPLLLTNKEMDNLPFLSVETDGNLFPQIIQSKIEVFILQTLKFHKIIAKSTPEKQVNYMYAFMKKFKNSFNGKKTPETAGNMLPIISASSETVLLEKQNIN
jgi:predicted nucleotide-binding protein (sugar kinase/HSP70/actin superfamily)